MTSLLTENLPVIASAPSGVKKLRELILQLAMMGKLVRQDPNDEPASELLKRIRKEREQLYLAGAIRRDKSPPQASNMERLFDLPTGWVWVRLGEIGDWGAGATPLRSNSHYYGGSIPWFKSGELKADLIFDSEEKVTDLAVKECSLRENKAGDVLIAMYGATIGKTAILASAGTTNQAVCACTPYSGVSNRFLLLLLKALKPLLIKQGAGGAQPNISREKIVAMLVGLPSSAEQQRIVAKVDELMAFCDRLEAQQADAESAHMLIVKTLLETLTQSKDHADFATGWERIKRNFDTLFTTEASIDALKQTVLQLAVMGKLVPQDPSDEPASELLKRIEVENKKLIDKRRAKGKSRSSRPIFEAELPSSWQWTELRSVVISMANGLYKPEKFYTSNGVISLRMYNIRDGLINFENVRRVEVSSEELSQFGLEAGDLLINRVNSAELVGKAAIVPSYGEPLVFESMNMRLRLVMGLVLPKYINLVLLTECARNILTNSSKQAISQASLNQEQIGALQIPLPPLAEQHRIVAKVDELMEFCDRLKSELAVALTLQCKLAAALIKDAANCKGSVVRKPGGEVAMAMTLSK